MDFIDIFILQYFGKFYRILQFNTLSVARYTKRILYRAREVDTENNF